MIRASTSADRARTPWFWIVVLSYTLVAVILHSTHITSSLGLDESNMGEYFGPTCRTWDRLGIGEFNGMMIWLQLPLSAESAFLYLNHPPLPWWLMYACGTEEWAMRLPGVVFAWAGSIGLFLLLRSRIPDALAFTAGLTMLVSTGFGVMSVSSLETFVVGAGVWLLYCAERAAQPGAARRWSVAAACVGFVGPWLDWQFAFYAWSLMILFARRPWREWVRVLWWPGLGSALGAITVLAWRTLGLTAGFVNDVSDVPISDVFVQSTVELRPGIWNWVVAASGLVVEVVGRWIAIAALVGTPFLIWRQPRFALTIAVAGFGAVVMFANHALDHAIFYSLAAPALVTAAVMPWVEVWRFQRTLALAGALAGFVAAWVASAEHIEENRTGLPREIVQQMNERADGHVVVSDCPFVYTYYTEFGRPQVFGLPLLNPEQIETLRSSVDAVHGMWYLWWGYPVDSPLGRYLSQFESEPARFESRVDPTPLEGGPRWVFLPRE